MASLAQMARSVQETANVEVIRALLHCHRFQQLYIRKHGIVRDYDLDTWWERKASRFMTVQKDEFALEILNTEIDREQEAYQAFSNTWILPREVSEYAELVPPEKKFDYLGGQEAVDRINGRPQNGTARAGTMGNMRSLQPPRMVRGVPVYIAKSFVVDGIGKNDLLSRITEVGIYNQMVDRCRDYSKFRTCGRDIRVYNNTIDDWSVIRYWKALENLAIWDSNTGEIAKLPKSRVGRMDRQTNAQDMEYDFLSYRDPTGSGVSRVNIEYIGDMSSAWLKEHNLTKAGQTLLNAISRHDKATARDFESGVSDLFRQLRNTAGAPPALADLAVADQNFVNRLFGEVRAILGADNVLVGGAITPDTFFQTFFLNQMNPAQQGGTGVPRPVESRMSSSSSSSGGISEENVRLFLSQVLGDAVPDSHKEQLQAIIDNGQAWKSRAKQVKTLIHNCINEGLQTGNMTTKREVNTWYTSALKDFNERMASSPRVSSSAPSRSQPTAGSEIRYFTAGSALPDGWNWVNPEHGRVSREIYRESPAKLEHFVGFMNHINAAAAGRAAASSRRAVRGTAGHRRQARVGANLPSDADLEAGRQRRAQPLAFPGQLPGEVIPARFRNMAAFIGEIANSTASTLVKWLSQLYLGTRFNRNTLVSLARKDVYVPLGMLLFRPHATYKTRFGIKCAANGESGYTFFGHSNMQIEHEAARKVGMMHYTAYLSAVVFRPKNVYVVEDMYCERYLGGMGVKFWKREEYTRPNVNRRKCDIICAPLPPNFTEIERKIDIRGKWYTEQTLNLVDAERFQMPLYPGANRMNRLMGWFDPVRKSRGLVQQKYRYSRVPINYCCFQGVQWHYNQLNGDWGDVIVEKGHFGHKVYPGCGVVRNGKLKYLKDPEYEKAM